MNIYFAHNTFIEYGIGRKSTYICKDLYKLAQTLITHDAQNVLVSFT